MAELIGDESIFLRIEQLKSGFLQFTDTTNAYRLLPNTAKISGIMLCGKSGLSGTASNGNWTTGI